MPPIIPAQKGIDTVAFSKTLEHTDTSYKFFWLLALLESLKQKEYNTETPVLFNDMFVIILKLAIAPIRKFKLSFGVRDQIYLHINNIEKAADNNQIWDWESSESITDNSAFHRAQNQLSDYVPYRWIRPFVQNETGGAGGATRNQNNIDKAINRAAINKFNSDNPPPYYIESDKAGKQLRIHPLWADYFARNAEVIKGWCLWHFAQFLQARNPNIPAIINKITVPGEQSRRQALAKQREFWKSIAAKTGGINCLYSGKRLTPNDFDLDHYVPWSFVGHDNIWNLVPAHSSVNSSKSDNLPHSRYIKGLIETHHGALTARNQYFPQKHQNLIESYIADLKLTAADLTDKEKLQNAYDIFIPPLIDLAKANHFKGEWVYNSKTPLMDGRRRD